VEDLLAGGYDGWISLEYKPSTTTADSLIWLRRDLRSND
jgi:hydroxypyruvate isomerase